MRWKDERYSLLWTPDNEDVTREVCKNAKENCTHNWNRTFECPSNDVLWTERNQFWVPGQNVEDTLELVINQVTFAPISSLGTNLSYRMVFSMTKANLGLLAKET